MKLSRPEKIESARIKLCSRSGETSCLIPEEMAWLERYYFSKYPKYNEIVSEYEIDKTRNKFKGLKGAFPSKVNWNPPMRSLLPSERDLLHGPQEAVTLLKKIQVSNPLNGRLVTYSSMLHEEKLSRVSSAYVCLSHNKQQCKDPEFGLIRQIILHKFCEQEVIFAKVARFSNVKLDTKLGMWCASQHITDNFDLYLIEDISEPLTVALDKKESLIWFLNYVH